MPHPTRTALAAALTATLTAASLAACAANAALNGVDLRLAGDFFALQEDFDLVLAADVLYDKANHVFLDAFLMRAPAVLVADSRVKNLQVPPYVLTGEAEAGTVKPSCEPPLATCSPAIVARRLHDSSSAPSVTETLARTSPPAATTVPEGSTDRDTTGGVRSSTTVRFNSAGADSRPSPSTATASTWRLREPVPTGMRNSAS